MFPSNTKDDTVHTLKGSAQSLRDDARDTAAYAKEDLRETANRVGNKVRHFVDHAKDEITHATDNVTTHINEKPVQSSLIALGVGFVLGALFRR